MNNVVERMVWDRELDRWMFERQTVGWNEEFQHLIYSSPERHRYNLESEIAWARCDGWRPHNGTSKTTNSV